MQIASYEDSTVRKGKCNFIISFPYRSSKFILLACARFNFSSSMIKSNRENMRYVSINPLIATNRS